MPSALPTPRQTAVTATSGAPPAPVPANVYRAILDRTRAAVFRLDRGGACVYATPVAPETPEWYAGFMVGLESRGSAPGFGEFEELRRHVLETGEVAAGLLLVPSAEGKRYLEYGIVPVQGLEAAASGTLVTVWDMSERIAAVQLSRRHERRLKLILDAATIPLTVIDSDGLIEVWNPAAERLSGLAAADVIGLNPEEAFPTPDRAHAIDRVRLDERIGP
jgi:PAS domain-containing protein